MASKFLYAKCIRGDITLQEFRILILASITTDFGVGIYNAAVAPANLQGKPVAFACNIIVCITAFISCIMGVILSIYPNESLSLWSCFLALISVVTVIVDIVVIDIIYSDLLHAKLVLYISLDIICVVGLFLPAFTTYKFWEYLTYQYEGDDAYDDDIDLERDSVDKPRTTVIASVKSPMEYNSDNLEISLTADASVLKADSNLNSEFQ